MNLLITTRTSWDEPPRLRHQVANLLLDHGHQVTFVERPSPFAISPRRAKEGQLTLLQHFQLIHHQLKPYRWLQKIHATTTRRSLSRLTDICKFDAIVNFNYDYGFLREQLPNSRFVTVINDDFEAQARPWMRSAITEQLRETCEVSDSVLTVSLPLQERLSRFDANVDLFFPWPSADYRSPRASERTRDVCLYYGYINHRLDFSILESLLQEGLKVRMVGPIEGRKTGKALKSLAGFDGFELLGPRSLEDVDIDDVCCSIAPYDVRVESVRAVSIGNRAFQLLRVGLPVIYPQMPGIVTDGGAAIMTAADATEFATRVRWCSRYFHQAQGDISDFLSQHSAKKRYDQLVRHLESG